MSFRRFVASLSACIALLPAAAAAEPATERLSHPLDGRGICADIARGSTASLEAALAGGADVNAPDPDDASGRPPLVCAAEAGQVEAVRFLLRKRARTEARSRGVLDGGRTALLAAAAEGHAEVVRLLLTAGARTDARDGAGWTPLLWAAYEKDKRNSEGFAATARTLLDGGGDPNAASTDGDTPLLAAIRNRNPGGVRILAARGANVNRRAPDGDTPLMIAAAAREAEMVEALLDAGARVDTKDGRGKTAWVRAAEKADRTVMALLNRAGARERYNLVDPAETFRNALCGGDVELAKRMAARGVRIRSAEEPGRSALAHAAGCGKADSVRYLLANGADPNGAAEGGDPPLLSALAYTGDGEDDPERAAVAALLAEAGADVNARGAGMETPLSRAVFRGDAATVRLLLSRGAVPDAPGGEETPPLVLAARWGRTEAAKALLEGGASPAARDGRGRTAWTFAAERGDGELRRLLEERGAVPEFGKLAWEGNESAVAELVETAIVDGGAWSDLWRRAFDREAPEVDFGRYFVACVFLGHDAGWWYSIGFEEPKAEGRELVAGYGLAMLQVNASPEAFRPPGFRGQYAMKVFQRREGLVPVVRCTASEDGSCARPSRGGRDLPRQLLDGSPPVLEERGRFEP